MKVTINCLQFVLPVKGIISLSSVRIARWISPLLINLWAVHSYHQVGYILFFFYVPWERGEGKWKSEMVWFLKLDDKERQNDKLGFSTSQTETIPLDIQILSQLSFLNEYLGWEGQMWESSTLFLHFHIDSSIKWR